MASKYWKSTAESALDVGTASKGQRYDSECIGFTHFVQRHTDIESALIVDSLLLCILPLRGYVDILHETCVEWLHRGPPVSTEAEKVNSLRTQLDNRLAFRLCHHTFTSTSREAKHSISTTRRG